MTKRVQMLLTFDLPRKYNASEIKQYMRDAIQSWSGEFHPDDELFGYDWNLSFSGIKPAQKPPGSEPKG